jgi:hypothetical protein
MKKNFLGLLCISMAVLTFGQNTSLGINGGIGNAWIKNYSNRKFKTAGNIGLCLIYSTKSNFGLGADLKYSIEGGKMVQNNVTTTTSIDYVRVPLKVMYFLGKYGQRVRPKISIGPSLGFLIGGETEIEGTIGSVPVTSSYKAKDLYKGFDIGLNASVGFNYRLVKYTWFLADINYYNGFSDIRKVQSSNSSKLSNNNLTLNVGVNWGLRR